MYVCVCVCVCAYFSLSLSLYIYIYMCVYVCVCVCVHEYMCTCVRWVCVHLCGFVCGYRRICECICLWVFVRVFVHVLMLYASLWTYVTLRTGAVVWVAAVSRLKNARAHQLSSIIEFMGLTIKNVTNQAEWPVEFKRDFYIITRELSRVALLLIIEPSNWSIKSLYKETR